MAKPYRIWTASDEELLRTMLKAGEPAATIAHALGRTEKAVNAGRILGQRGGVKAGHC